MRGKSESNMTDYETCAHNQMEGGDIGLGILEQGF